jgi:hypothetical protein
MTGGADQWEPISVMGTPASKGVLTLKVETFSSVAGSKTYIDDIKVIQ